MILLTLNALCTIVDGKVIQFFFYMSFGTHLFCICFQRKHPIIKKQTFHWPKLCIPKLIQKITDNFSVQVVRSNFFRFLFPPFVQIQSIRIIKRSCPRASRYNSQHTIRDSFLQTTGLQFILLIIGSDISRKVRRKSPLPIEF